MITIGTPQVEATDAHTTLSAVVEGAPGSLKLWFRVPTEFSSGLNPRPDAFVAALVIHAMRVKQPVHVRGALSLRLAQGLIEYQRIFHSWFPSEMTVVDITADDYTDETAASPTRGIGAAFSGGVDSFFTLLRHLPGREKLPRCAITHLVFVHGFDVPLPQQESFAAAAQTYAELATELGVKLMPVATNLREVLPAHHEGWELSHGSALAAVAHAVSRLFGSFYIPSTDSYAQAVPWGSDYRLDHLLSADGLQIIHDGADVTRMEKVLAIAKWPACFSRLRVCWENPQGLRNCGRCEKCLRTLTALEIAGVRQQIKTFDDDYRIESLASRYRPRPMYWPYVRDLLVQAQKSGRGDVVAALKVVLRKAAWASRVRKIRSVWRRR